MIFDKDWETEILDNGYYSDNLNIYEVYLIWSN